MIEFPILCGACKRQIEVPLDPDPNYKVVCAGCGRSDRFDYVLRTAQEHFAGRAQKELGDSLARGTRGNSFVKFEAKRPPHRSFRWITG